MQRLSGLSQAATRQVTRLAAMAFPKRPPWPSHWRSVLVLRPCCIGDVLQSTALVSALRHALPEARIGYAVGPWSRPVLEHNPDIDVLVDAGSVVGGTTRPLGPYHALVRALRTGQWDACFVLERSPLFGLAAWAAGIPDRIGPDSGGRGASLTLPVPIRPRRHEAESYLDLARAAGVPVGGTHTSFHPSPSDHDGAVRALGGEEGPFVALAPAGGVNPGASLVSKRWPAERFGQLARRFRDAGLRPLLLGAANDRDQVLAAQGAGANAALDLSGSLTLGECGAVLSRCSLFVGNDTGLLHLASAVGTPVVGLFGPTDPAVYGPYGGRQRVIWHPQPCSPCFRQPRQPACALECMTSITVDEVEAAAQSLLG